MRFKETGMRYKFKVNGELSKYSFATRDAAFAAGLFQAGGVFAGVQVMADT